MMLPLPSARDSDLFASKMPKLVCGPPPTAVDHPFCCRPHNRPQTRPAHHRVRFPSHDRSNRHGSHATKTQLGTGRQGCQSASCQLGPTTLHPQLHRLAYPPRSRHSLYTSISLSTANKAISEMNGHMLGAKPLYVNVAQRKEVCVFVCVCAWLNAWKLCLASYWAIAARKLPMWMPTCPHGEADAPRSRSVRPPLCLAGSDGPTRPHHTHNPSRRCVKPLWKCSTPPGIPEWLVVAPREPPLLPSLWVCLLTLSALSIPPTIPTRSSKPSHVTTFVAEPPHPPFGPTNFYSSLN